MTELSLGSLTAALTAGAWDVPFMPLPDPGSTTYSEDDGAPTGTVATPFGSAFVVKALTPDAAFIHVDGATLRGDGIIRYPRGESAVAAAASRQVVLVAEEIVDDEVVSLEPYSVAVPGLLTSAVVVLPGAVHPDGVPGRYPRDISWYESYSSEARTQEGFDRWVDRWILQPENYEVYRREIGVAP